MVAPPPPIDDGFLGVLKWIAEWATYLISAALGFIWRELMRLKSDQQKLADVMRLHSERVNDMDVANSRYFASKEEVKQMRDDLNDFRDHIDGRFDQVVSLISNGRHMGK